MANVAKKAILRAKVEGILTDLMVKTTTENVWVNDTTTLSAYLAEIIADVALKANAEEVNTALAGKAASEHTHEQGDITGLTDTLATLATTEAMNAAISAAIDGLIDGAPETYNTLKEIADYISQHEDVVETLNAAIGNKADKSTVEALQATVDALGALAQKDKVSESDLDTALAEKVNAAAEGNHSHANKTVLDGITAEKVSAWDAAEGNAKDYADTLNSAMNTRVQTVEGKAHTHANAAVLDGISAENITAWDGKSVVSLGGAGVDLEIEIVE